jgi:hypothetical protein
MEETIQPTSFGPYRLTRRLPASDLAERFLAVHDAEQSSHLVYAFGPCFERAERRRIVDAVQPLMEMNHPHLLAVEHYSFVGNRPWVVSPYPGNQKGLVTLADLVAEKGGQMEPMETDRLLRQLLGALAHVHDSGFGWGRVDPRQILVDRSGRVVGELVGVARRLEGMRGVNAELMRDEVREVIALGYRLVTSHEPDELLMPASRLAPRLTRRWDMLFEDGLEPAGGFDSAHQAMESLPSTERTAPERGREPLTVKTVFGRVRGALRQ